MTTLESLRPDYFEAVYAAKPDPWDFESSAYERDKYKATVAALPARRFAAAFEIGCSIGVLTEQLADCCDNLLAVDVSDVALTAARQRLANRPQVQIEKMAVPAQFPEQQFDLVLLSEVGYYWSAPDLALASARIVRSLDPRGALLLVHWTPQVHDYPLTGDAVHEHFLALSGKGQPLQHLRWFREATYRLDLFERSAFTP